MLKSLICFVLFASVARDVAHAQDTVRIARAALVQQGPVVDGVIDDAVWASADPIQDFIQAEPLQGTPASERTVVRIVYNKTSIFVSVVCYDSEPGNILVTDSRRDSGMEETDSFQMIFDTYHDRQNGFVFGTNPAGIEYDGQVSSEGQGGGGAGGGFNLNWDASWRVRTRVTESGWTAEFEIPLRSLRYGSKPQVWGVNFQRNIRRKREQVYWSPVDRIYNLYRLSSAGELHGLEMDTPRNFKITPFGVTTATRDFTNPGETGARFDGDIGMDVKFGVTPSLNLDLTVNTDFAQVEADEQQINLTRFNLFFPEKRPFFLENAGTFAVGRPQSVDLFFSRRIGIARAPTGADVEVPILGGARLSGKAGAYNIGLLNMLTDDVAGVTAKNNFTVGRISRELPNRSSVGGIVASRDATGSGSASDDWNRTLGLDGRFGIGRYADLRGFVARTRTPGKTGRESAYNLRAGYERQGGNTHFEYTQVGEDFNPEVGFLTRRGYRNTEAVVFKNMRFASIPWLRELRPHTSVRTWWDFDGFKESETIHMDSHVDFESGWFFSPAVDIEYEGLKEPFEIHPGVVIPPGKYRNTELDWRFNTDQSRAISLDASLTLGGFYSGDQRTFGLTLNGRKGHNVNASAGWTRRDIDLPEGSFVTNLLQARFNYSFTPSISFQSLVQYNDRARNWSGNFRLGWLNTAGTGLFIVYNETQALEGLGPISRSFIVKYNRQIDILR